MTDNRASMASRIQNAQTPAEELRRRLTRLENLIGQMNRLDQAAATEILGLLDGATALIVQITESGGDLAAELTRYDTLTSKFDKNKAIFVKKIGGSETLQQMRARREPEADLVWWYADVRLSEENQQRRTRALKRAGITALVIVVLTSLYMLFLAPDEITRERYRHEQSAEQALIFDDPTTAQSEADLALTYMPDDSELLILKGIALELQGETDEAQALYDQAESQIDEPETFLVTRARTYLLAKRGDLALADAQQIVESDPNSALGYFMMGNANASLFNNFEAAENFERASELAGAAGNVELQGMARVQLANLTMNMQAPNLATQDPAE